MHYRHLLQLTAVAALLLAGSWTAHGATVHSLHHLDLFGTGNHAVDIAGHNFQGHVNHDGQRGWLLVGRGREGWEFDADGPGGAVADVSQNLGTTAAFTPTAYTDTLVNDLITDAGVDLTDMVIRLHRATNTTGTSTYQEARWTPTSQASWTWDLDAGSSGYAVEHEVDASILNSAFFDATSNTRDTFATPGSDSGNNATRVFTWAWGSHNNQQGFSYGQSIQGVNNNDPNTFLWENGNEGHAIPYTEVYIRLQDPVIPEPTTLLIWSLLAGLGVGLGWRRRK